MSISRIAVCLMALFLCYDISAVMGSSPEKEDLRVMSYNVRNCIGMDDVRDIKRTATVINNIRPDVVAIQELDSMTRRSDGRYILGELAAATYMNAVYAPAIDYDGGRYGIGLLSREKPVSIRRYSLPGREEQRALVIVEFKKYAVACTHLSLTKEDAEASVRIIKDAIKQINKPMILCGDLNSHPDSKVIADFEGFMERISDNSFTFPASSPNETIDYIFLMKQGKRDLTKVSYRVVDAPVESDHRPIAADFTFK